jgi:uncharacterized hydrophobic protein (TIGR00271 family)
MRITLLPEERDEVISDLHGMAHPSRTFIFLIILSTGIAAFGLLANSTAVVIGAMLVAPLMGPIFSIALSLVRGDRSLLARAGVAEVLGVIVAVGIALLIGAVPLRPEYGSEILARTQPTLYDILIALFSGLAGSYSIVNKRVSTAIAGVAVATALVPPLATCGLLLAAGSYRLAMGAFLLFVANFVAIQFAASVVFLLAGFGDAKEHERTWLGLLRVLLPAIVTLILLGALMTQTLVQAVHEQRLRSTIRLSLTRQLNEILGAQLSELEISIRPAQLRVIAAILTPHEFTPERVATMERQVEQDCGQKLRLIVRSLLSRDVDSKGMVFLSDEEMEGQQLLNDESKLLASAGATLRTELMTIPEARLVELTREADPLRYRFTAVVETPEALEPEKVGRLEAALASELNLQVQLTVRSILTRIATARRFVDSDGPAVLASKEELELRDMLTALLEREMRKLLGPIQLAELRIGIPQEGEPRLVFCQLRAQRNVTPREVTVLEEMLRRDTLLDVRLVIRTTVGVDTASEGYLDAFDFSVEGMGVGSGTVN